MKKVFVSSLFVFVICYRLIAHGIDCNCGLETFDINKYLPSKITSSSILIEKNKSVDFYSPNNLCDGSWKSWVEGEPGDGIDTEITYSYESPIDIDALVIRNGYGELKHYYNNNRVELISIHDGKGNVYYCKLRDTYKPQYFNYIHFENCTELIIKIHSIYKGTKYTDTCISEMTFLPYSYNSYNYIADDIPYEVDEYTNMINNKIKPPKDWDNLSIIHYLENGKVILLYYALPQGNKLSEQQNDKWSKVGISYFEFYNNNWIESSDSVFDIIKSANRVHLYLTPYFDELSFKSDFHLGDGTHNYILTGKGFEQVILK